MLPNDEPEASEVVADALLNDGVRLRLSAQVDPAKAVKEWIAPSTEGSPERFIKASP